MFTEALFPTMVVGSLPRPQWIRDLIEDMSSGVGGAIVGLMFMFFVLLVLGVIFATLGGVLGALMFRRNSQPLSPGL